MWLHFCKDLGHSNRSWSGKALQYNLQKKKIPAVQDLFFQNHQSHPQPEGLNPQTEGLCQNPPLETAALHKGVSDAPWYRVAL